MWETVGKYSSRMLLISIAYIILKNMDVWAEFSLDKIQWDTYRNFAQAVIENLHGKNYEYFFQYFVDIYFFVNLTLLLPFLYFFDAANSFEQDKYASFMKTIFSMKDVFRERKIFWSKYSKLGFLTVCVKFFYIPLLVSWVINNTFHQNNLNATFKWDIYTINTYLVALFIYIDTIVFCFGYLIEFRPLKNVIKTVEPTILGWVVCLWCYPPFNVFSFKMFDYQIMKLSYAYPHWLHLLMTCLITILWGIFAWASLTLGFKASNLTNRGIVRSGPYRFLRHPAYAAKLLVWYIQGIFLGQFTLGILLGFTLIYALRAWTEERHLSLDPDYKEYKRLVPWGFIPRLI